MQFVLMMLSAITLFFMLAQTCWSNPIAPVLQHLGLHRALAIHLPTPPTPECFILTVAPPLEPGQCDTELRWFLEDERRHKYLDLVGANAPYTYTRPRIAEDTHGRCFVSIIANDLFVTDRFTFEEIACFTQKILTKCRDGRVRAGRGGVVLMTTDQEDWGGFKLRVDAWNPFPRRSIEVNTTRRNGRFTTTASEE